MSFVLGAVLCPLFFFGYSPLLKIIPQKPLKEFKGEIFGLNFLVVLFGLIMIFAPILFARPASQAAISRTTETIKPGIPYSELVFSIRTIFALNLTNQEKVIVRSNTPWQLELENYDNRLLGQNLKVSILYPSKTIFKNIKVTKSSLIISSNSKPTPNSGIIIIIDYPAVNPNVKFTLHSL